MTQTVGQNAPPAVASIAEGKTVWQRLKRIAPYFAESRLGLRPGGGRRRHRRR